MTALYVPPLGIDLIFASKAEVAAASPEAREARDRIVANLFEHPEDFGMRWETPADLDADHAVDRQIHGMNQDWG